MLWCQGAQNIGHHKLNRANAHPVITMHGEKSRTQAVNHSITHSLHH